LNRLTEIKEIYDYILSEIIKDEQAWKDFLTFHAKVYKHSFKNAVLIYAQRPEATLVADMEIWNRRIGRWINRGAKSIAVFDDQSDYLRLKYLFDIEDTHGQPHTMPRVWRLSNDIETELLNHYQANTLSEWISRRTYEIVNEHIDEIQINLQKEVPKTKLSGLPIEGVTKEFVQSLVDSVEYMTAIRSGIEVPKLSNLDAFRTITDFDSKALTLQLGHLTSSISEQLLREIEREIKSIKSEKRSVSDDESRGTELSGNERNLPSTDSSITGSRLRQETAREIRSDGVELSERGANQSIQLSSDRGDAASKDASSERGSMGTDGTVATTDVSGGTDTRSDEYVPELSSQGDDSDESRGSRIEGNRIQGKIESEVELPERSSFFVPLSNEEIIETVLLRGSNFAAGKQRIVDFFADNHNAKEKADFLKNEYGTGGSSITFSESQSGFENHDSKGIKIDVYKVGEDIQLSWAKVAAGIERLIENGKYFEARYHNDEPPVRKASYQPTLFDMPQKDNDIRNENYQKLMSIAPEILNGRYRYMKLKAPGFMDLVIERLYENRISLSHYYEQNGDLMSDPDMELIVDHNKKTLTAATFQQDNLAIYHEAYQGDELIDPDMEDELNDFLKDWLSNISRQGHIVYKAYYSEDVVEENEEPLFDERGNEVLVKLEEESDDLLDLEIDNTDDQMIQKQTKINYRFSAEDEIGIGGLKTKFRANVESIKTLKVIEEENRMATDKEQSILARYVGWGGIPQAFDISAGGWSNEYGELKGLLSQEEYDSAKASTPNAHYTAPIVIQGIYHALDRFGFEQGNILEPSMGVGNFFSHLPESMNKSKLFGVELDDISGRISKQLYQAADIQVKGFEETQYEDNFFDVAIGNVPFGNYKVYDRIYDKHNFMIHDYFFGKTLDKVRPGGIIAFVTSKGTMDKKDQSVRKYINERAELIGAIRLPNTAFKDNANTDVTADILFLKKRERRSVELPTWLSVEVNENGVPVNQYFIDNPHMMLGEMVFDERMFGRESRYTTCINTDGNFNLEDALINAVSNLKGEIGYYEHKPDEASEDLPADSKYKNYSYAFINDKLYFRENSMMRRMDYTGKTLERIQGMMAIRDITREIIALQIEGCTKETLEEAQEQLNKLYDEFTHDYGYLVSRPNANAFRDDNDYPLLCSLEVEDEEHQIKKADMFTKQTIKPYESITNVDSAFEALTASLNEKGMVDLLFMSELYDEEPEIIIEELKQDIYLNPERFNEDDTLRGWETADAYLSGDVRQKLKFAKVFAELNPEVFSKNVIALEKVQPVELEASDIDVRLGTTWIEPSDYEQFIYETLKTPRYYHNTGGRNEIKVHYNNYNASFGIENKGVDGYSVSAKETYGTSRINAYYIIEDSLNLRNSTVKDRVEDGDTVKYVINKKETMLAREKQSQIKQAFKEWLFKDPERRKKYVSYYNQNYNNIRLREYDGSHLKFPGMNPDIKLREHQTAAISRILYGGSTLLAHSVGAGKTFEMVASCMEQKRLGLINKAILVVPNHLTQHIGSEFLRLYPSANILVTTKKDFQKSNRRRFVSRIATGAYDAVIMGHSQFEKIPVSKERQEEMIHRQINDISAAIADAKRSNGENWSIKQMEKLKLSLTAEIKRLHDSPKDDVINFEELGVDCIYVDEAHYFKNCAVFSKIRNVAGISNTRSKKSMDMLMKTQYIQEINQGRGVIFATGTPISNSMAEMYVMQRYIQNKELEARGIHHFDAWAAQFGEVVSSLELAPEGTGYRYKSRFAKFTNLPELMMIFKNMADVKTADMLKLPIPKLKGAGHKLVSSDASEFTKEIMESFVERASDIRNGLVDPRTDNMLKIVRC
jgi:N12 class adenine-specific DNA methylase/adenine-specific DNA methylase